VKGIVNEKNISFKFKSKFKCRVSLMTSLLTEDCSRFLPPQHRTLDRRLLEDVSVAQLDPLTTQNANVVDLEDRRHAVDCQTDMLVRDTSDTETRVLPA